MKKRLLLVLLIFALVFSFSGCVNIQKGPESDPPDGASAPNTPDTTDKTDPDTAHKDETKARQPEIKPEEVAYYMMDAFVKGNFAQMDEYLSVQSDVPLSRLTGFLSADETTFSSYLTAFSRTEYTILSSTSNGDQGKVKITLLVPSLGAILSEHVKLAKQQTSGASDLASAEELGKRLNGEYLAEITSEDVRTIKTSVTITFVNENGTWKALADDALYNALTGNLYAEFVKNEDADS